MKINAKESYDLIYEVMDSINHAAEYDIKLSEAFASLSLVVAINFVSKPIIIGFALVALMMILAFIIATVVNAKTLKSQIVKKSISDRFIENADKEIYSGHYNMLADAIFNGKLLPEAIEYLKNAKGDGGVITYRVLVNTLVRNIKTEMEIKDEKAKEEAVKQEVNREMLECRLKPAPTPHSRVF